MGMAKIAIIQNITSVDEMLSLREDLNFDISKLSLEGAKGWSSNDRKR